MDPYSAELAFGWHMQNARLSEEVDPDAAVRERVHALELAERFDLHREVAQACGVLCWDEMERFGAPLTERYVRLGLAAASRWGAHTGSFLMFEALYQMERGALDAAERRFTEALSQGGDAFHRPRVLAGLGALLLRGRRFEEAKERFAEGLQDLAGNSALETRLQLLDGLAEAQRHGGDAASALATSESVLEVTSGQRGMNALAALVRRYRARAFNARGLLQWRGGARVEAERDFVAALEVWAEPEKLRAGEAFVAWERLIALDHGLAPPVEGSPGDFCALSWVRLGRDILTPVRLTESPPSRIALARAEAWQPGDQIEIPLRSILGHQVGERWHVSRVQTLRPERRVLVELVAAGPVE